MKYFALAFTLAPLAVMASEKPLSGTYMGECIYKETALGSARRTFLTFEGDTRTLKYIYYSDPNCENQTNILELKDRFEVGEIYDTNYSGFGPAYSFNYGSDESRQLCFYVHPSGFAGRSTLYIGTLKKYKEDDKILCKIKIEGGYAKI